MICTRKAVVVYHSPSQKHNECKTKEAQQQQQHSSKARTTAPHRVTSCSFSRQKHTKQTNTFALVALDVDVQ